MTKSRYPYAPDEFDAPAPQGAPVGVHRSPRTRWSKTWPFLLVAVVFAGLAYGGFTLLSDGSGEAPPQAESTDPPAASTETPGDAATETPAETEEPPAETEEPPVEETPAAPDLDALMAAADPSAYVRVLNASGLQGMAAQGAEALEARGFTEVEAADYEGSPDDVAVTTVWYAENRSDTAAAVAAALGVPAENVVQQPLRSGDVVVIVKSELTPAG
ncbi:LytR C-terminal domain-containing protein [Cellulosimicrobium sp. PMB13]|uniref:LytR C-terminal domain-containing protein n=1 Tax=Cellulosimicrobium sp. PMB13 TaxID=3120158 RepID=UPI003F4C198D